MSIPDFSANLRQSAHIILVHPQGKILTPVQTTQIQLLHQHCFPHEPELRADDIYRPTWCILEKDALVGYLQVLTLGDALEVLHIAISPQYRRKGYAKQLVDVLLVYAKKQHIQVLTLEVSTTNTPARSLYEQVGFVVIDTRKKYYRNGDDAVVYQLHLQASIIPSPT